MPTVKLDFAGIYQIYLQMQMIRIKIREIKNDE